jgi:large exoprotein involved in heme utilization and adhesion
MHLHLPSGTVVTGTSAAMANAAFLSLATQASISLVNNKGNLGKTFKELGRSSTVKNLATAVITAGVADKIGATSTLNSTSNTEWVNNLSVNLANAGSSAVIGTAINGGSLQDSLESAILSALVQTAHGAAASKIKDLDNHYIAHKVAHAVAGCAAAAANKGKCQDGAIGAAVGEIVGEKLLGGRDLSKLPAAERAAEEAKIIAYSRLVAGTAAGLTGGDVNVAADAAKTAVQNNLLAFNPKSDPKAKRRFADKVESELGGKFELKGTGKFNSLGYEIMALVPVGNATTASLNAKQLSFYNMLNNVIQDKTGTAQITLVYNDGETAGGNWITGRFDVSDMEKLDTNKVILSGNALIAHEFNEQIVKNKFHLVPLQGKEDQYYNFAHESAVIKEIGMMKNIISIADNAQVNGVEYSRIYYDNNKKQMLGVNVGTFSTTPTGVVHNFDPRQTIIKPNANGSYIIKTQKQQVEFTP